MTIRRIVPNITSAQMEASLGFYRDLLGLVVVMDMEWIITLVSPGSETAQISLVRGEPTSPNENVTLSVEVADVDGVHAAAVARGHEIEYPPTDEPWGVRRFHLRDPNGILVNVLTHGPEGRAT